MSILIYFSVIIIPTGLFWHYRKREKWKSLDKIWILIALCFPIIVFAIRQRVGIDWEAYYTYYNEYNTAYGLKGYMDYGFNAILYVCKVILKKDFYFFSGVCCALLFYNLIKSIRIMKLEKELWIGYYTYLFSVYFFTMNGLRSGLAASFLLTSLSFYLKKSYKKWLLTGLIAMSIHATAIVGFLIPGMAFLYRITGRVKSKGVIVALVMFITFVLFFNPERLISIIHILGLYQDYGIGDFKLTELRFILYFLPETLIIMHYMRKMKNEEMYLLFTIFMSSFLFQVLGSVIPFIDRLFVFSSSSRVLLYPLIHSELNGRVKQGFEVISIGWFMLYFSVIYIYLNGNAIFPYHTLFN